MRVGVYGAGGRVGVTVCKALMEDGAFELVAAVDPKLVGIDMGQVLGPAASGLIASGRFEDFQRAGAEVVVDFSEPRSSASMLPKLAGYGISAVVGTTGFTPAEISRIEKAYGESEGACLITSNFSIGAIMMIKCAELVAPFFDTIEIIEMHHDEKIDAPSGTALTTASRIEEARKAASAAPLPGDPTRSMRLEGARGARSDAGIAIHSVRMRGMVAHQEVIFGTKGQTLTVRHDSYDRSSFVPGVFLALRRIAGLRGFFDGFEELIE